MNLKRILAFVVLLSVAAVCAEKSYVKGTLVNITVGKRTVGVPSNGGTLIAQKDLFQVEVQVDDLIYTGETRSHDVNRLVVGDQVEVCLQDKDFFLKASDGKEIKIKLLTKARAQKQ